MKHALAYFLLCTGMLLACNTSSLEVKKGLPGVVFKMGDDFSKEDSSGNEGLAIKFYNNGEYSHYGYNFYAYGKWHWDAYTKMLTLTPTQSKDTNVVQHYKIEKNYDSVYTIQRMVMLDSCIFKKQQTHATIVINKSVSIDPFAREMNTWRIKPTQSESEAAIRERTVNYLKFLLCYYEYINESELDIYAKRWYPTPIQLHYRNGARMAYNTELADWYACFYNTNEADEGYKLIASAMRKSKIAFALSSIAKRNIDYIKQLIKAVA